MFTEGNISDFGLLRKRNRGEGLCNFSFVSLADDDDDPFMTAIVTWPTSPLDR
jgi:hypothetical protein